MGNDTLVFVGLDTHKDFTEVAYCDDVRGSTAQHYGKVPSTKPALTKLARQCQGKYPGATLHFVYEAGPCGVLDLPFTDQSWTLLLRRRAIAHCQKARRSGQDRQARCADVGRAFEAQ